MSTYMRISSFKITSVNTFTCLIIRQLFSLKTITAIFILSAFQLASATDAFQLASATEKYPVSLTADTPFVIFSHQGTEIKIKRIQDTQNRLVDDFSKTSRPCPPFCIHPMSASNGVETFGELELIDFMKNKVNTDKGLLIDARMPRFFNTETIPGSINIPFILFTSNKRDKVLTLLGVMESNGKPNFSEAIELCLFCNGPWCDQSPRAIKALIKAGYPTAKLKYYRGGMQLWKIFSLTTVLPKSNIIGGGTKK